MDREPMQIGELMQMLSSQPVKIGGETNIMALYHQRKLKLENESNTYT